MRNYYKLAGKTCAAAISISIKFFSRFLNAGRNIVETIVLDLHAFIRVPAYFDIR